MPRLYKGKAYMPDIKPNSTSEIENMYAASEEPVASPPEFQPSLAPPKKGKGPKVFWTIILIVILVFVVLLIISKTTNWDVLGVSNVDVPILQKPGGQTPGVAKASDWQAVFLTNGQVYFGKLKDIDENYATLEDIYYLQVQEVPIQPAEAATQEEGVQPAEQTEQRTILVKFGTELHRPTDKMYINSEHILFFEDLSQGSNVVEAIENYKAQQ